MKLIQGLLNYSEPWTTPDMYLFTGNSTIKKNGAVVMGRGAAKQVRDTYLDIDKVFGNEIRKNPAAHLIFIAQMYEGEPVQFLGWFKVKHHWGADADLDLIKESTAELKELAERKPHLLFHMNYPGVGNGRLNIHQVQPVLETLPDNVLIYR